MAWQWKPRIEYRATSPEFLIQAARWLAIQIKQVLFKWLDGSPVDWRAMEPRSLQNIYLARSLSHLLDWWATELLSHKNVYLPHSISHLVVWRATEPPSHYKVYLSPFTTRSLKCIFVLKLLYWNQTCIPNWSRTLAMSVTLLLEWPCIL